MENSPEFIIQHYLTIKGDWPINRIFHDNGQSTLLEELVSNLKKKDSQVVLNSLDFLLGSVLDYGKKDWLQKLNDSHVKGILFRLLMGPNHFVRMKTTEALGWFVGKEELQPEIIFEKIREHFAHHYQRDQDPLLLNSLYDILGRRGGGVYTYDYQISMLTDLLGSKFISMQVAGLECLKGLHADRDEIPEQVWQDAEKIKHTFDYDFFHLSYYFERHLKSQSKNDYLIQELDDFIQNSYDRNCSLD